MPAEVKISYQSKDTLVCPACDSQFHREELLSGSGRLIAGPLTEELHRLYEPSSKYGVVFPLVYQPTVCPTCWFTSMDKDFVEVPKNVIQRIQDDEIARISDVELIFPQVSFKTGRNLINGAASHYLALRCYDYFPKEFSPTIKQGIAALRTAWLLEEMDRQYPEQHYSWLAILFKKKAQFFYTEAMRKEQTGKEPLSGIKNFGPDTDKNYAYEGALYLSALLLLKYGPQGNGDARRENLSEVKRTIAKIFGLGRSTKDKPGPLLEHARNLYDVINKELNEVDT